MKTGIRQFAMLIVGLPVLISIGACTTSSSIIAATGTVIGVELSQNTATQAPQGTLGYKRAELAYVPTNRGSAKRTTKYDDDGDGKIDREVEDQGLPTHGNGAADTGNVLMELRYNGIFNLNGGNDTGIYQRLAVGNLGVVQPGAQAMFAKGPDGKIDDNAAELIAAQKTANQELAIEAFMRAKILDHIKVAGTPGAVDATTWGQLVDDAAVKSPGKFNETVKQALKAETTLDTVNSLLEEIFYDLVETLYRSI